MTTTTRHTADDVRVTFSAGIVSLGFEALNRKPLPGREVALLAECVGAIDGAEVAKAIKLARTCSTPRELWRGLEPKAPRPSKPRRVRRGDIVGHTFDNRGRMLLIEY